MDRRTMIKAAAAMLLAPGGLAASQSAGERRVYRYFRGSLHSIRWEDQQPGDLVFLIDFDERGEITEAHAGVFQRMLSGETAEIDPVPFDQMPPILHAAAPILAAIGR